MKIRLVLATFAVPALCALVLVPLAAQNPSTSPGASTPARTFTPVTDAMLRNPSADDWLHWRRTLDGWGYSPLNQSNRQNVGQLQLAWSWAMQPGSNQATPLVHDGVMYLPNPNSVVQALDAATGDLLWEYRREFPQSGQVPQGEPQRNLAIWDDKRDVTVRWTDLHDNVGYSPYEGRRITGWPTTVISRGRVVVENGTLNAEKGSGQFLKCVTPDASRPLGRPAPEITKMASFGARPLF